MSDQKLWEILVPTVSRAGKPYRTRYHRVWDQRIREISSGLTIFAPSKGQWVSPDGTLLEERMIPVRFMATKDQAEKIAEFTLEYYDQLAVLCCLISDDVIFKKRAEPC